MAQWIIHKTNNKKFPFRIRIIEGKEVILSLFSQDTWPGQKGNIFCLREKADSEISVDTSPAEALGILSMKRLGKKLSLVLDRPMKKRCDFLFLEKQYKSQPGSYEQIFFRTQQAVRQHKSKGNLNYRHKGDTLDVVIDSNERYPWSFPDQNITKEKLSAGDYALMHNHNIVAIVERKTFSNMKAELGSIQVMHQRLHELALYPHSALIIESQYNDFLDPSRVKPYSAAYAAKVIAEITAAHPTLPVIFAGNRKDANYWCMRFFESIAGKLDDKATQPMASTAAKAKNTGLNSPIWSRMIYLIEHEMPDPFTFTQLMQKMPSFSQGQIRTHLNKFKDKNIITAEKGARHIQWHKAAVK